MKRSGVEWREERRKEREGRAAPEGETRAARVSKAEVSSTKVYHPFPLPLDMACRPIFTIPRLPTIPFGFSLINSSNSRAGCLEFVEGVWGRVHQSVCKSNHRKWIRYLLMTYSGNSFQSFTFPSNRRSIICELTWNKRNKSSITRVKCNLSSFLLIYKYIELLLIK